MTSRQWLDSFVSTPITAQGFCGRPGPPGGAVKTPSRPNAALDAQIILFAAVAPVRRFVSQMPERGIARVSTSNDPIATADVMAPATPFRHADLTEGGPPLTRDRAPHLPASRGTECACPVRRFSS